MQPDGESTAERISREIGVAFPGGEVRKRTFAPAATCRGCHAPFTLNPMKVLLNAAGIPLATICRQSKARLEAISTGTGFDIAERRSILNRRRCLLRDLDKLLTRNRPCR